MGRADEAISVLRAAVRQDEKNPWAHRNLGTMLLQTQKAIEAVPHFRAATQLLPEDQLAWLGLADAQRLAGNSKEAENAYLAVIKISPHSELADKARAGSSLLAQSGFERTKQVVPRQDAVHYCLEAMQRFAQLSPGDLQKLSLELALAGRRRLCGSQSRQPLSASRDWRANSPGWRWCVSSTLRCSAWLPARTSASTWRRNTNRRKGSSTPQAEGGLRRPWLLLSWAVTSCGWTGVGQDCDHRHRQVHLMTLRPPHWILPSRYNANDVQARSCPGRAALAQWTAESSREAVAAALLLAHVA